MSDAIITRADLVEFLEPWALRLEELQRQGPGVIFIRVKDYAERPIDEATRATLLRELDRRRPMTWHFIVSFESGSPYRVPGQ